jgi:hypothetical protein
MLNGGPFCMYVIFWKKPLRIAPEGVNQDGNMSEKNPPTSFAIRYSYPM